VWKGIWSAFVKYLVCEVTLKIFWGIKNVFVLSWTYESRKATKKTFTFNILTLCRFPDNICFFAVSSHHKSTKALKNVGFLDPIGAFSWWYAVLKGIFGGGGGGLRLKKKF
jgi:hypothetical protein